MPTATAPNPLGTEKVSTLLRRFAIPAIISMLVNALYNIVDQIFIGRGIGELGMAATNIAFPLTTISTALALLMGIGGAANFNLSLGRGEEERASHFAGNALSMLAVCGAALGIVTGLFTQPLLLLFGGTESIMEYALPYTVIIAVGLPFAVLATGLTHLTRADGSPLFAMIIMLSGAVFNLVFDPIFLFVFDMGIVGIALATSLGQILSTALGVYYMLRRFHTVPLKRTHLRPRLQYVKRIAALGMASCFNQLSMALVQVVMNNVLRHYGAQSVYGAELPLAAVGAISKVQILFISFVVGIAQGCQPIISFNYGARNYARVKEALGLALGLASAVSIAFFAAFQLFPRQIIGIFGEGSAEYVAFAVQYLRIFMFMNFVNGLQPVTGNFFSAIGKAQLGLFISLTRQVLFLLPLVLIFPLIWGIDGVLYAGPISDATAAILAGYFIVREVRTMTQQQRQLAMDH